jgi:hypothetical protein
MRLVVALILALAGCSEAPVDGSGGATGMAEDEEEAGVDSGVVPGSDAPLIDLSLWQVAVDDPFPDRPAVAECPLGYGIENGLFEISSDLCPYGAFTQPSLSPVRAGDEVEFILVHDALYSEDPQAEAHIGIALGDQLGWDTIVPIPAAAGFFRPKFEASDDAPAGTPVTIHIHNHGVNNYRVVEVTVYWR